MLEPQVSSLGDHRHGPRVYRWLRENAEVVDDPPPLAGITPDPDDDYLIALARATHADYLISGDRHLLGLTDPEPPVLAPRQFRELLGA